MLDYIHINRTHKIKLFYFYFIFGKKCCVWYDKEKIDQTTHQSRLIFFIFINIVILVR